ncbi:hypothetical protein AB0M57_04565 [Streptomyces sp. NPDC051597]|uniref:hypothetical protein n=1 Tax=Streptomyces sp. NPDC051597 TaxID=3155049 RepID=UPI00343A4EBA
MTRTLTDAQTDALHWAAVAIGLKEARARQGHPLTPTEESNFDGYQTNAHNHGLSDSEIRDYLAQLPGGETA